MKQGTNTRLVSSGVTVNRVTAHVAGRALAEEAQRIIDARHSPVKQRRKGGPVSKYTPEIIRAVLLDTETMSMAAVARKHNIPYSSIVNWVNGVTRA